ncbi:MAG: recombinase family protein [Eubacteriales bacterium]|nr:recombinase family protein [Eubacteriales bacterium]MDD4512072.1 recombinase family protein [Eubacteriales bacterium]
MGFRTGSGAKFTPSAVWSILSNPLYAGYIRWGKRLKHIEVVNGATVESRQRSDEPIIAKGIHPAIISQELFDAVQARLKSNPRLVSDNRKHVNPLAGLMYCSKCGNVMILSPDIHRNRFFYKCLTQDCPTSGIIADYVFEALINTLHSWLNNICLAPVNSETATDNRNEQKKSAYNIQLRRVAEQRNKICDLLEQGVYSTETYLARNAELEQREADIKNELAALDSQPAPPEERIRGLTDEIKHVLDVWERTTSAEEQSALLRTVISKIIYIKTERGYRNSDLSKLLTLQVFPAL